ncbi:hypothetical protein KUA23_00915 [Pseudomonas pergaminensis]|uniref:TldD/PmbA family protein n=1 Tax=Pseudomonas pergaminensis TaxID=2853159 RepID=A0ABD7TI66_9PSED|nr:hypothetical protein [Pseudomonas pergaminensis]USW01359.1 hypothetical protein KUA23_00915 [Pseudomonas pergaminensis]
MEKNIKGAWILQHGQKLQATTNQDFDAISFAGKCGKFLSAISAENQEKITDKRLEALAKANYISPKTEVPAIIAEFKRQKLILPGAGGIEVLGLTGREVLSYTATIFDESDRETYEDAVISLSEATSDLPITNTLAIDYISDTFKLAKADAQSTLLLGSNIGFFDTESISPTEKLIFNGNLFRREDARKINAVLSTLSAVETQNVNEVNSRLNGAGCLPLSSVTTILGEKLFSQLHSIGMFDVSVVGNESGKNSFVTRPAAFSKFTNSIADDALDLAKALVASLTYGMTVSTYYRGKITAISSLMQKLIDGGTVGPATAIGNDYQALEYKGVVKVSPAHGGMFNMKLLKPEVGRLALSVIQSGNITGEAVDNLPGAKVTSYTAPEATRDVCRKNSTDAVKLKTRNLLNEIRTGGLNK